ncbi:MAG: hypothetical protein ACI9XZ_002475, partial [Alphaproteobacteria bacterium]
MWALETNIGYIRGPAKPMGKGIDFEKELAETT